MTKEEFRDYVDSLRSQNEISYDVYSGLIDGIDTLEQEPKTGRWLHRENMDYLDKNKVIHNHFMCQDCGFIHDFIDGHTAQYKYCPNCGAKMVEPQESEGK